MTHATVGACFDSVLIVEDCPVQRHHLKALLQQCGIPITCIGFANNLAHAYAILEQTPQPTLTLIDISLPEEPGEFLIQWVQAKLLDTMMMVLAIWATQSKAHYLYYFNKNRP
ncbi:MAG: response regulator [Neisseriaceae bacterium]|nr:response regulator [Neisseriaceae bacterium]MBP6863318.1 response regulator [Neisseriaceae bacterium]